MSISFLHRFVGIASLFNPFDVAPSRGSNYAPKSKSKATCKRIAQKKVARLSRRRNRK